MKINRIGKPIAVLGIIFLTLAMFSSNAFCWGSATHAYIDDHLGKRGVLKNINEMYGGMAPDVFNYLFDKPTYLGYLCFQTHNEFLKVWDASGFEKGEALAYGFVSHNDLWGADSTAHHSGLTFGTSEGYIIAKAYILTRILEQVPEYQALGLPEPVALEVSHNFVEAGVDILIKRIDPFIGKKIAASALRRSPEFPFLLLKAYAQDFSEYAGIRYLEAAKIITSAEREFRKTTVLYGQALMQDEATALQLISEQMAELSTVFLTAYGVELPEGTDLTPLIQFAIDQAMVICADDFAAEVTATINFVDQQLKLHGIDY